MTDRSELASAFSSARPSAFPCKRRGILPSGNGIRLLIVEDSELDTELLLREFRKADFDPVYCRIDDEASLQASLTEKWDLAITDYLLPGFDGLFAMMTLLQADPDLPVIMVSGRIGEETAVEVMRAGARDCVMKDNLQRLMPVVRRELQEAEQRLARRKAEEALRISEQRFSELAENVDEVFWLASPDWAQSFYVSPAFYDIWGWQADGGAGVELPRPWRDAIHANDLPMIEASIRQAGNEAAGVVEFPEFRIIRPSGHVRWIKSRAYPVRDKNGELVRFAGTAMDITTRRNAEESLLRSNRALRALSACNQALVRETDEKRFVAEVCRIIVEISGYCAAWVDYVEPGQADGLRRVADAHLQSGDDIADNMARIQQRLGQAAIDSVLAGKGLSIHRNLVMKEDLPVFSVLLLPLSIDQEQAVKGILTIVSSLAADFNGHEVTLLTDLADDLAFGIDTLRTREEHEHLQNQLLQARKMEAVGQLSGGIAHDFNNMLSSILGYAGLALERPDDLADSELDEYLQEVIRAGERARDVIGKMLSFSRARKGQAECIEVRPIICETIKMLRFTLPASIVLDVDPGDESLAANIDPVQLQQIIMNLSINARDAMRNKGVLNIVARALTVAGRDGRLECQSCRETISPGDYIDLSVRDTGGGIDQELLDRIFDPFFTTKDIGKGTGMGLSVVHGIVHEAAGHILVESVRGEGMAFRILLPASAGGGDEPATDTSSLVELGAAIGAARILVVDDETSVAGFLRELLHLAGYEVVLAGDGAKALEIFQQQSGRFDLVVTDQTMPNLTGAELARQLLALSPDLPVILCTGYSEEVDEACARKIGIQGYMEKPVSSRVLLGRIAELLEETQD